MTTVLGANGRLGSMLARHSGRSALGWQTQQRSAGAGLRWLGGFDEPAASNIFCEGGTIINMIGHTGTDTDRLQQVNVDFVRKLLRHAADKGVSHVLLASSAAVYGNGQGRAFHESDPMSPTSAYGASKAAMEEVAHAAPDGPKITILRIGNVAGADTLLHVARTKTAAGEPTPLHRFASRKAATRSYIGPLDLARVTASLVEADPERPQITTLNIAHPTPVTLDDLLASYRAHLLPNLKWNCASAPDGVPERVVLDVSALEQLHNFAPANAETLAQQVALDLAP